MGRWIIRGMAALIPVVILFALAASVATYPAVHRVREESQRRAAKNKLRQLKLALEAYSARNREENSGEKVSEDAKSAEQ